MNNRKIVITQPLKPIVKGKKISQRQMARDALKNHAFFQRKIPEWQAKDMGIIRVVNNTATAPTQPTQDNASTDRIIRAETVAPPTPNPASTIPKAGHTVP